jgi:hypothetical protein
MNLVWKILGITAAVFLTAAAVISFLGLESVKQEQILAQRAKNNLDLTRQRAVEADDSLKENKDAFAKAETDRDQRVKDVEETNSEEAEYTAEIAARKVNLEQVKQRVADIKLKIRELGSIEKLLADIENIEQQVAKTENEIVNRDQKLKIAVEKVEEVTSSVNQYAELESRQRKALVEENFQAKVSSVFPKWGFVLLDKGNSDGIYANAELEIQRDGQPLGRLFVTRVEQFRSVANYLPHTWPSGTLPQSGDLVVRAPLPEISILVEDATDQGSGVSDNPSRILENDSSGTNDPFGFGSDDPGGNAGPASDDPFGDF